MLCGVVGAVNVLIHKILRFGDGVNRKVRQARYLRKNLGELQRCACFRKFIPEVPPGPGPAEKRDNLLKVMELARA